MKEKYFQSNRYYSIDFMRAICAFLIICIHGLGTCRDLFIPITRIAVPFFFMVSGYFIVDDKINSKRIENQTKKLIKYFLICSFVYISWDLLEYKRIFNLPGATKSSSLLGYILKLIFFNCTFYAEHLWFIIANVYILVIYRILKKTRIIIDKKFNVIVIILLISNLILGSYCNLFFYRNISLSYTRNFLFTGIPFFFIGVNIRDKKLHAANLSILILGIIFSISSILEYYFIKEYIGISNQEVFITTILGCTLIFSYCISNKEKFKNCIAYIGSEYSLIIYVVHPIVLYYVKKIDVINTNFLMMIIVYIFSLLIGCIIKIVKRKCTEVVNE